MARGNDAAAAAEELKAKLGAEPNAQEMIDLSAARWPEELRAANNRAIDEDATDELEDKDVEGLVGDRNVLGYAVRGPFVVVVSEDDSGFTIKQAFARKGQEKQAERLTPKTPEEQDEEAAEEDDKGEAKGRATAAAKK